MDYSIENINSLLDNSKLVVDKLSTQLQKISSPELGAEVSVISGDGSLNDVVEVLVDMGNGLKSVKTVSNAQKINASKLVALKAAIEKLMMDPTTEHKILALQAAIFGGNTPILRMLREMQETLRVVESLRKGVKVEDIDGMDPT